MKIDTQHNHLSLTSSRWLRTVGIYFLLVVVVVCIAPWWGAVEIHVSDVWNALATRTYTMPVSILLEQRVPRVLLGLIVGAGLGLSGAMFQVLLRNPLATPYTLGVAGASALGAAIAVVFPFMHSAFGPFSTVHLYAFAGSIAATVFIVLIARSAHGFPRTFLILAGVALNMFCGASLLLVRFLADPQHLVAVDRWTMGGLVTVGYAEVGVVCVFLIIGTALGMSQAHALNQMGFGESVAAARGVATKRVFFMCLAAGVVLTTGAVAVAGPIGFVGLIVPHAVRMISGADQRVILPASACASGALLVCCDIGARTIVAPTEIPVGIITAFLGTPIFLFLLIRFISRKEAV